MSLLTDSFEECVLMDRVSIPDGYGSYYSRYQDGAHFFAGFDYHSSIQAKIAAAQGVKDLYSVLTGKNVTLNHHDVFRRVSDGRIFRVTTNGTDNKTPESAGINARKVDAEEWELPNG